MDAILIVSGDRSFQIPTVDSISSWGLECLVAESLEEAIRVLEDSPIDILLIDADSLPEWWTALPPRARELQREICSIIISTLAEGFRRPGGFLAVSDDFLRKPFYTEELKLKIDKIQTQKRLESENKRLLKEQAALTGRLSTLLNISMDMTSELEVDRLFPPYHKQGYRGFGCGEDQLVSDRLVQEGTLEQGRGTGG